MAADKAAVWRLGFVTAAIEFEKAEEGVGLQAGGRPHKNSIEACLCYGVMRLVMAVIAKSRSTDEGVGL